MLFRKRDLSIAFATLALAQPLLAEDARSGLCDPDYSGAPIDTSRVLVQGAGPALMAALWRNPSPALKECIKNKVASYMESVDPGYPGFIVDTNAPIDIQDVGDLSKPTGARGNITVADRQNLEWVYTHYQEVSVQARYQGQPFTARFSMLVSDGPEYTQVDDKLLQGTRLQPVKSEWSTVNPDCSIATQVGTRNPSFQIFNRKGTEVLAGKGDKFYSASC